MVMTLKPVPRQPTFNIETEEWGHVLLEDNTIIDLRFILMDLVVTGEDMLGPQIILGHTVGIRSRAPSDVMEKVKDKPLAPEVPPPLTAEAGYETIKIKKVEKPIRSSYFFEEYLLVIELNIESVARNMRYKMVSGSPIYNLRWTTRYSISKATS
jgi:hypothetical protein